MSTAIFGLVMTIAYDAPWWVWVIGFLCVMSDAADERSTRRALRKDRSTQEEA